MSNFTPSALTARMRFDQPFATVSVPATLNRKYSLRPSLTIFLAVVTGAPPPPPVAFTPARAKASRTT